MKYDLKRPCAHCPFRNDIPAYLHPERVEEIRDALERGGSFACHKTTVPCDDEDEMESIGMIETEDSQFCAGAMILMEKDWSDNGGVIGNQLLRIMHRLGAFDPSRLDLTSTVFDSFDEMIEAQPYR